MRNLRLKVRLNLILSFLFIFLLILSTATFAWILEKKAEKEIQARAYLAIELINGARTYTSEKIQPELVDRLYTENNFLKQTVPAYSARTIFENFQKNPIYQNFSYREATVNPTNLNDRATEFELSLINSFKENEQLKQISGFRAKGKSQIYYTARPLKVEKLSCLQCHSLPENAPQSLINTYGANHGFNWQLNEIVASQIVSMPAEQVFSSVNRTLLKFIMVSCLLFILGLITINIYLKNFIVSPLRNLTRIIREISFEDNDEIGFPNYNSREINDLAQSLKRLNTAATKKIKL